MWETTLESTGSRAKMLHLLSEKWVLHIRLIWVKPEVYSVPSGVILIQKSWDSDGGNQVAILLKVGACHRDDELGCASGIRVFPLTYLQMCLFSIRIN